MRFDSYHPTINLIYFVSAFAMVIAFRHPAYLLISYVAVFLYSVKLRGKRALVLDLALIPMIAVYAFIYLSYNHFGVTNFGANFIGNQITLESVVYGCVIGVRIASCVMLASCMFVIVSADKVVYLFGRISPKLSLFLAILLRGIPRVGERGKRIERSRRGIGKGCFQGNILQRLQHFFAFVSVLITWTLEDLIESAASMKCRGYSLKGRTAFSIYRFDNRDRSFVIAVFACLVLQWMAVLLDQTDIYYNPRIILNRVTPLSWLFYLSYAVFLLLPMGLQIAGEWKFRRQIGRKE